MSKMYLTLAVICVIGQIIFLFLASGEGRRSDLKNTESNLVKSFTKLDSTSRIEILDKIELTAPEIVRQINKQSKATAKTIVTELNDKFQFIESKVQINTESVQDLSEKEKTRIAKEKEIQRLKSLKPEIKILEMGLEEGKLIYLMELKNKVPLDFTTQIFGNMEKGGVEITGTVLAPQKITPSGEILRYKVPYNTVEKISNYKKIKMDEDNEVMIRIRYSSIYNGELRPDLSGETSEYFLINIKENKFKKIEKE